MNQFLLAWTDDGSLVSVELSNDQRVVLVFADEQQATAVGARIAGLSVGRRLDVLTLESTADDLHYALSTYADVRADLAELTPALPGEPLFEAIVGQLLADDA